MSFRFVFYSSCHLGSAKVAVHPPGHDKQIAVHGRLFTYKHIEASVQIVHCCWLVRQTLQQCSTAQAWQLLFAAIPATTGADYDCKASEIDTSG
jgi:hypothetical protein